MDDVVAASKVDEGAMTAEQEGDDYFAEFLSRGLTCSTPPDGPAL